MGGLWKTIAQSLPKKTSWRAVGGHKATICRIMAERWKPLRIPWLARRPKFFASSDIWDPCKTPLLSDSSTPPCVPSSFLFLLYFLDLLLLIRFLCFFLPFPRSFMSISSFSFLASVSLFFLISSLLPFSSFFLVLPCPGFSVSLFPRLSISSFLPCKVDLCF